MADKIMIIADHDRMVQVIKGVKNGKVFRSNEFTDKDKFIGEYNYLIHQGLKVVEYYKIKDGIKTQGPTREV